LAKIRLKCIRYPSLLLRINEVWSIIVKMNGMSPTMELKVKNVVSLEGFTHRRFRAPISVASRWVGVPEMYKITISTSANQLNESYFIIRNDGEFNMCIECDETCVTTVFYSPQLLAWCGARSS
jgi:hypothetical protein